MIWLVGKLIFRMFKIEMKILPEMKFEHEQV